MVKQDIIDYMLRELSVICPYPKNTAAAQSWALGFVLSQLSEAVTADSHVLARFRATVKGNRARAVAQGREKQ